MHYLFSKFIGLISLIRAALVNLYNYFFPVKDEKYYAEKIRNLDIHLSYNKNTGKINVHKDKISCSKFNSFVSYDNSSSLREYAITFDLSRQTFNPNEILVQYEISFVLNNKRSFYKRILVRDPLYPDQYRENWLEYRQTMLLHFAPIKRNEMLKQIRHEHGEIFNIEGLIEICSYVHGKIRRELR